MSARVLRKLRRCEMPASTARRIADMARALHPVQRPPQGAAWNLAHLDDLIQPGSSPRLAAVLVPLIQRSSGMQVVLTRRTAALRHHGGQVSFPGGGIDARDDGPVAAALREAHEEIGLTPSAVSPIGFLDPFLTVSAFHVFPLVASVDPDATFVAEPGEVAEVFEVPLDFLLDPANLRHGQTQYAGRMRDWVEFSFGGHRIWGATAGMLVNLRQRLEQL